MYTDRWSPGLRQGDILGEISFPSLGKQLRVITTTQTLAADALMTPVTHALAEVERRYVAVVSHDCEFNEGKRNKFLVAKIQDVPGNLKESQREALRASNDVETVVDEVGTVSAVDSFVIEPIEGVFDEEQVVVFTSIIGLPMAMRDELVKAKCAEMEQQHRMLFRKKLAWFFGRDAEDIDDAKKFDRPLPEDLPASE